MTLAERIRRAVNDQLVQRGISQREMARRLGWSQPYTWRRLAGHTELSLSDLDQIANALGLTAADLVSAEQAVTVHHPPHDDDCQVCGGER